MHSSDMQIVANSSDSADEKEVDGSEKSEDSDLKVGEVKYMVADGGVRIEQSGQIATSEKVTFYPAEEKAILTGDPKLTNGEAVVTGQRMELKPKLAIITGGESIPVIVRLPEMPDLGYDAFSPTSVISAATPKPASVAKPEQEETVVKSRLLRMIEEPGQTLFRFTEEVEVSATNLDATCDRLDVIAKEQAQPDPKVDMPLELQRIEAHDNVVVKQTGRTAIGGKAIILPKEGKVILEGSAVVIDERGKVSGHRMVLNQGDRRAVVEGGGPDGERAKITLPALPAKD
jgi:lipopolysaccharide export system protein LptA